MDAWVFLSGPMGAGKTTLGRALSRRLGARFVDLDAKIEGEQSVSIAQIFERDGEAHFRALEREAVARLLEGEPAVVSLGGGTVAHEPTRRRLLEVGTLITLRADLDRLLSRVGEGDDRPLAGRLVRLLAERADAYAECHAEVRSDRDPEAVVDELVEVIARDAVVVPLGRRSYRVSFESLSALPSIVEGLDPSRVIVVTDDHVDRPWARSVAKSLKAAATVVLPAGEEHKTIGTVERIWDAALDAGVDRRAVVVTVGGGVVGDLGGFAAATLMRGVRFVQVPTTTLAMVDASVGGKTGFDRAQGKNLVGAFHQPSHVLVDVKTLDTLPDEELRAGLAEAAKAAWLDSEAAVAALERDADRLLARDRGALSRVIRRSVELKARVVAEDEREGGRRRVLNLGHTVGHAIEAARGYVGIRHGEAVSLGMIAAFRMAARLGDERAATHEARARAVLGRLGLPTDFEAWWTEDAARFVGADKKRDGDDVRFIVPGAPGEVRVRSIPIDHEFGP